MMTCSAVEWMRTGGSNSRRSRASVGIATIVSMVATSVSRHVSACAADQVSAIKRQIAARSSSAFGVSRYPAISPCAIVLPHARLEGGTVEGARLTARKTGSDLCLQGFDCGLALLVFADQVTDIVACIAE